MQSLSNEVFSQLQTNRTSLSDVVGKKFVSSEVIVKMVKCL